MNITLQPLVLPQILEIGALLAFLMTLAGVVPADLHTMRIPDRCLIPGSVAVFSLLLTVSLMTGEWEQFRDATKGAVGSFMVYAGLYLIGKDQIGFGDVKFAAFIGFITNWFNQAGAITAVVLAFAGAGIAIIVAIMAKVITSKTEIPFGPWMALGALAVLVR